jgi:hypothetical protein
MSPLTSSTTYVCGPGGPQVLTVTVTDNHAPTPCTASVTMPVTCVATTVCESLAVPAAGASAAAPALPGYNPPADFTIEGWVYPTAIGPDYSTIAAHWDTRANGTGSIVLYYDPTGNVALGISTTGTDEVDVTGTTPLVANKWAHVAGTFSAATQTMSIFKDGVLAATRSVAFNHAFATSGVPFSVGSLAISAASTAVGRTPQTAVGFIDEARYSNVVRYTGAFTPATTFTSDANTLALYHFDETTGTTAADASPAANPATLGGGATHFAGCPALCTQDATVPAFTTGGWLICGATAGPGTWNGVMTFTSAVPDCYGAVVQGTFNWVEIAGGSNLGVTKFVGSYTASSQAISVDEVQLVSGDAIVPAHDFMSYDPGTDSMINGGWNCPTCNNGMWAKATHVANPATATCP